MPTTTATATAREKTKPKSEAFSPDAAADYTEHVQGFTWDGRMLRIDNPDAIKRIRRLNFSASAKGDMSTCAAMFAVKSVLPRVMGPLEPAPLGNVSHEGLEHFYDLAAEQRERDALLALTEKAAREHVKPYEETEGHDELFKQVWDQVSDWVQGIYKLEDPKQVDVYATEQAFKGGQVITDDNGDPVIDADTGEPKRTPLVFLSNGVPFVGYLDRTDNGTNGRRKIRDYKFGAKAKGPSQRFGDQYGDQMRLYKDVIETNEDVEVEDAVLLWPRQGKLIPADLSPGAVKATLNDFKREYENMNAYSEAGAFPTKPGNLCAWCPAANSCPVANIKSANAINHAKSMPGGSDPGAPVSLGIPTVRSEVREAFEQAPPADPYEGLPHPADVAVAPAAPRIGTPTPSHTETIMTDIVQGITPVAFPNNKWAAKAAVRVADAAAVHLAIYSQPLTRATISALARILGTLVERVVKASFIGGFDWTFDAATEATSAVISTIKGNPAPFGSERPAWDAWQDEVVRLSVLKLTAGVALLDEGNPEGALGFLVTNTTAPA